MPYLIEREGTICENLPETHAVLKQIRRELDAQYRAADAARRGEPVAGRRPRVLRRRRRVPHGVPLSADAAHVHGLRQEDRHPIVEILHQTPDIPDNCQWALFLRNHDELTLEMVTDEERDYMYLAYAADPQMRINVGIRRRLAPLMENSRRRIELLNSLLFSMPGTPIIYYGDEIGMGDNIYLGDRNGVRTPMQWTSDRNAGFSRAIPRACTRPVDHGPGLRLPGDQRRGAGARAVLAAALDEAADRAAQAAPGLRPRLDRSSSRRANRKVLDLRPPPRATTSSCASPISRGRVQPVELPLRDVRRA